mmetsp:Transcript_18089/g.59204  ORF Transcript_18089/g.59204 Transcript_18089/m.59204 type:complete len:335 (+) Transcript_18089:947-1951(+)
MLARPQLRGCDHRIDLFMLRSHQAGLTFGIAERLQRRRALRRENRRRVEHGGVEYKLVKVVSRVVVVRDVPGRPLFRVAVCGVRVVLQPFVQGMERAAGPAEGVCGGLLERRRRAGVGAREQQKQPEDVAFKVAVHVGLAEADVRLCHHLAEERRAADADERRRRRRRSGVAQHAVGAVWQHQPERAATRQHGLAESEEEVEAGTVDEAHPDRARKGLPWRHRLATADSLGCADRRRDAILVEPVAAPRAAKVDGPDALQLRHALLGAQGGFVEDRMRQLQVPDSLGGVGRRRRIERHKDVRRAGRQVLQQVDPVAHADPGLRLGSAAALDAVP